MRPDASPPRPRGLPDDRPVLVCRALFLAGFLLAAPSPGGDGRSASPARHAILISVDSLRADHLALYGYPRATMPAVEALARRRGAVVFDRATSPSPSCHPAHAAMLTGLYPHQVGVAWCGEDVLDVPPDPDRTTNVPRRVRRPPALDRKTTSAVMNGLRLPGETPLLQEALRKKGMRTAGFVSIWTIHGRFGYGRGFERFEDDLPDYYGPRSLTWLLRDGLGTQRRQVGAAAVDRTIDFFAGLGEGDRAFVFLSLAETHAPYATRSTPAFEETREHRRGVAAAWKARYPASTYERAMERMESGRGGELLLDRYDRSIRYVDAQLERLFSYLESSGQLDETLIVLTSDHGDGFGQHRYLSRTQRPRLFFEHSLYVWEETLAVPMVVFDPATTELERRRANVSLVDVAPTILARLGFAASDLGPVAGTDALALGDAPRTVFFLTFGRGRVPALLRHVGIDRPKFIGFRRGDLKFFIDRRRLKNPSRGRCFLYDLASDPHERHNLCRNDATARRYRWLLVEWYSSPVFKRREGKRRQRAGRRSTTAESPE